ncbi:MAG: class I SAM-dependent methyltransferase [Phaeodactylibacter sp.]|uniref:class I SAM-dependent methyltransferase n=1 Tax=Phaeodactylibacter sp. TaxID=1940289 RepID=UPI0032ED0834
MKAPNAKQPDTLYTRLFAKLYDPVMEKLEARLLMDMRRSLLAHARGRVLEVGAGTGVNFPLYNKEAKVLAIEPAQAMAKQAESVLQGLGAPHIQLLEAGVGDAAVAAQLGEDTLDAVVSTLVLCTIPDLEQALQSFRQWLRPGGQLLVLEHIHDDRQPQRWIQSAVTPVWKHLAEGCYLNRRTDELLKDYGFEVVEEDYHYTRWVPFYTAVLRVG